MTSERNKMMIKKLEEQVHNGSIEKEWEQTFLRYVSQQVAIGNSLSFKQQEKLEELFERY